MRPRTIAARCRGARAAKRVSSGPCPSMGASRDHAATSPTAARRPRGRGWRPRDRLTSRRDRPEPGTPDDRRPEVVARVAQLRLPVCSAMRIRSGRAATFSERRPAGHLTPRPRHRTPARTHRRRCALTLLDRAHAAVKRDDSIEQLILAGDRSSRLLDPGLPEARRLRRLNTNRLTLQGPK